MPGKYDRFDVSGPILKHAKCGTRLERLYCEIRCGVCKEHFIDLPVESILTSKASKCKQHWDYECGANPNRQDKLSKRQKTVTSQELVPYPLSVSEECNRCCTLQRDVEVLKETSARHQGYFDQMAQVLSLTVPCHPPMMIQEITEQRDAMEHKMEQQREDMKQQTADIIRHSDNRWSSFANVMVNKFPSLQEPVNDETIPQQMCIRERSIQLSSSSELEAVRLENRELRTTNKGLVEAQKTLNEKFRVVLQDRDARVDVTTYQRLLAKYDKLRTKPKQNRESMESFRTVKRQPIAE